MAFSLASAPPLVKKTLLKPSGARSVMRLAASPRCRLTVDGAMVVSRSACSLIAATTAGCWWPMFTFTNWLEKSRYWRPEESHTRQPWPPEMTNGFNCAWADQEWKTCLSSSTARASRSTPASVVCVTGYRASFFFGGSQASRKSGFGDDVVGERRDHRFAVDAEGLFLVVVLQVAGELVDAELLQGFQLLDVVVRRPEQAEAFDDLVWHELRVGVAGAAVLVVVVALATGDVVGERLRYCAIRPILRDDVGDVVADHPAEPPALVAHVAPVVADVHGCCHAELDRHRIAASCLCGVAHRLDHPLGNIEVGHLQDEPVTDFTGELQRQWAVCRHPHVELRPLAPRELQGRSVVFDRPRVGQFTDDVDRLAQRLQGRRRAVHHPNGRVAPSDATDGAVAVHLVQGGVDGCRDRPVPGGGIRHHRADHDLVGLSQDAAVDNVWLLPEQVRVEGPEVAEPVLLGELGQLHGSCRGRVGLQYCSEVHVCPLCFPSTSSGASSLAEPVEVSFRSGTARVRA